MSEHACVKETQLALMDEKLNHNTELTEKIYEAVNGNGKPGLKTEIAVLQGAVRRQWYVLAVVFAALGGAWMRGILV